MQSISHFRVLASSLLALLLFQHAVAQDDKLKIGLIGDSTVATTYGWGPALEKRFDETIQVLHFAKNGATLESLSKKLDELLELKPNYVIIQFGHNDQKRYGTDVYRTKLTSYVQRIKAAGAKPIVFSSVTRRNFDERGKILPREQNLLGNLASFAKAAQAVAREQSVPFVDLYSISVEHHNQIGPEATAAYDFNENDKTHFSPEGAQATANLILSELKTLIPEIASHVRRETN
ncbi:rhamnogalacturonan acetylesterase [Stieleria varia]|uniref:Rhamnogalacturonan acetylesterase RhgT n=1 Tax=Stieleria varia TaxID=2528005 RepID=A0A5C5ZWP4_9BACT|nr:rhamnogalacturonan acetylesterase [Stieleria varia]TWT91556.1 Rhamnogalacturonan acetylesterase RhgT [Stieleria varia]